MRSNRVMKLMASAMVNISANLASSTFSLPASRSSPESTRRHATAYETAAIVVQARLGQWDEKTTAKNGEGRIVRQEDEARESAVDDDAGRDQDHVRGAEEEHPAPRHRPVRQDPMVHQAVGDPQQHRYGQESDVLRVPEARPVGQQEDTDQPDEPSAPDRDPCRIQDHVRVAQGARHDPLLHGANARLQQVQAPGSRSRTCMRVDIPDPIPRL